METILKFKTNINCNGCISTVTPFLNSVKGINQWEVDITDSNKILTVKSDDITSSEVINILHKAGYSSEIIK